MVKTFKTIHQLSCFVGHPVVEILQHRWRQPENQEDDFQTHIMTFNGQMNMIVHCNYNIFDLNAI